MDSFSDLDQKHGVTPPTTVQPDSFAELDNDRTASNPQDTDWDRAHRQLPGPIRKFDDFMRAASNSATFGLADRFASYFPDWFGGGKPSDQPRRDQAAAENSPYTTMAGQVVGGMLPAARIARGLQAVAPATFAGAGMAPLMRTGAATSATMSAADDAAHGRAPDPVKALVEGGVGGAIGGGLGLVGKVSPYGSPGFRASGQRLTDANKADMATLADKANALGIPLSIPELADAAAPGSSGGVVGAFRSASQSPGGATAAYDFARGRQPTIPLVGQALESGAVPPAFGNLDSARRAFSEVQGAIRPENRQPFIDLPARGDAAHTMYHDLLNRGMDRAKTNMATRLLDSDNIGMLGTNSPTLSAVNAAGSGVTNTIANNQYPLPPVFTWGDYKSAEDALKDQRSSR